MLSSRERAPLEQAHLKLELAAEELLSAAWPGSHDRSGHPSKALRLAPRAPSMNAVLRLSGVDGDEEHVHFKCEGHRVGPLEGWPPADFRPCA